MSSWWKKLVRNGTYTSTLQTRIRCIRKIAARFNASTRWWMQRPAMSSLHSYMQFQDTIRFAWHPRMRKWLLLLLTVAYFITWRAIHLKNAGAIYQWPVNKVFKNQINRNIKIYVDDIVVKSHALGSHVNDLKKTFVAFYGYQMKLNLSKCTFRVISRKFLEFMISHKGIETNIKKTQAIT